MPDRGRVLVTNTTPLIALTAAIGSVDVLRFLYDRVVVPLEVAEEVRGGGRSAFGVDVFQDARWLEVRSEPATPPALLRNSLDRGEAAVIQTALDLDIPLVCIDEAAGRRVARLCALDVTGSIGILLKARRAGFALSISDALGRMREHGIWLSERVARFALAQDDEWSKGT